MLAIAAFPGSVEPKFVEQPSPLAPQSGEVLCQTLELGVCGTDREILHSKAPWTPPDEDKLILGHECLARIKAVGPDVANVKPGDLVVPIVRRRCGPLAPRVDNSASRSASSPDLARRRVDLLPFGAFTERGIVREHGFSLPLWLDRPEYLFAVPTDVADLAVLTEPLAVSEKGVNEALLLTTARLGPEAWSSTSPPRALVTGMGPIGFTAVLACDVRGWEVTMVGRDEPTSFRARLVEQLGGRYLPLRDLELPPADVEHEGYDLLLECTGSDDVLLSAARHIRSCGVIVWLGSSRTPHAKPHHVERLVREGLLRNHIHLGCVNAAPRDFQDALAHLAELAKNRRAALASLITARVRPENSLWHYEHREPQGIKTVVMYS